MFFFGVIVVELPFKLFTKELLRNISFNFIRQSLTHFSNIPIGVVFVARTQQKQCIGMFYCDVIAEESQIIRTALESMCEDN